MTAVPFAEDFSSSTNSTTLCPQCAKNDLVVPPYTLPATYQDADYQVKRTDEQGVVEFLKVDFDLERLHGIHWLLGLAGRKMAARPLHRQAMMGRAIVITEQMDLHLVWSEAGILIKPFPAYLLNYEFWQTNICSDESIYRSAKGFVLSYAWLISREVDFNMAQNLDNGLRLLPEDLKWPCWTAFIKSFSKDLNFQDVVSQNISKRYQYGELRLGRLNGIYRLTFKGFMRGYHFGFHTYDSFFRRNFAWLIVVFAYISIVLTAMQVGLAVSYNDLQNNAALIRASYGFAIFSMVGPAAAIAFMIILFAVWLLYNGIATVVNHWRASSTPSKAAEREAQKKAKKEAKELAKKAEESQQAECE